MVNGTIVVDVNREGKRGEERGREGKEGKEGKEGRREEQKERVEQQRGVLASPSSENSSYHGFNNLDSSA